MRLLLAVFVEQAWGPFLLFFILTILKLLLSSVNISLPPYLVLSTWAKYWRFWCCCSEVKVGVSSEQSEALKLSKHPSTKTPGTSPNEMLTRSYNTPRWFEWLGIYLSCTCWSHLQIWQKLFKSFFGDVRTPPIDLGPKRQLEMRWGAADWPLKIFDGEKASLVGNTINFYLLYSPFGFFSFDSRCLLLQLLLL